MGFTTTTFLFAFLPVSILVYFAFYRYMSKSGNFTAGNVVIAVLSYFFYAWALDTNAVMLLFYVIVVYFLAKIIAAAGDTCFEIRYYVDDEEKTKRIKISSIVLAAGLFTAVYLLYHFKYASGIVPIFEKYFYIDTNKYSDITIPVGISFITFSTISYFVDIYSKKATSGSFLDCFMYIYFFPKIISGPVVTWKEFEPQMKCHPTTTSDFVYGINRIIIGFAKKVILADTFGSFVNRINDRQIDGITACLGWLAYALQIYYDFSGYSDIAIGLSRIFGIKIRENFNFPYRSLSLSEFWRRWHISLGEFFREYVYIPLGGNRKGMKRTLINLAVVFLVTGIWHGAGLAYIIWGIAHGICVIAERMLKDKQWYQKIPNALKWVFTFIIVASLWQLFRFGNLMQTIVCFEHMMGIHSYTFIGKTWEYFATGRLVTFLIIGLLGATVLGNRKVVDTYMRIKDRYVFYVLQEVLLFGLLIISVAFMINSSYSPFIYFQF